MDHCQNYISFTKMFSGINTFLFLIAITLVFNETANGSTDCPESKKLVCPDGLKPKCVLDNSTGTYSFECSSVPETTTEPCTIGQTRNSDGNCTNVHTASGTTKRTWRRKHHGGHGSIRAPCPESMRSDRHGKCRQALHGSYHKSKP